MRVLIRGGGDLASGVAWRLYQCGFRVLITEIPAPLSVRRKVSFCEAVFDRSAEVEGVRAVLVGSAREIPGPWERGEIPVLVDPECRTKEALRPEALVDAIIAKRNLGTTIRDAPLVIALGPGFEAGKDAHFVVETNRGHRLGRLLTSGSAEPDTGVPGPVKGITSDRVLRSPADGLWENTLDIGDMVKPGDLVGFVEGKALHANIAGVIRGLIHRGVRVREGLKVGDIDPRGNVADCFTISDKALAIAGGVIEGIVRRYGRQCRVP
ncbi:MAG: EF2563 family selenium-dependent molybdenum hydroxylase system protein [Deltaproteobacteria bacterium]|nr:EF2563 family selenium-dependent molybdenum hydroxylase system protein [Deltaproteobacteria bacterium]